MTVGNRLRVAAASCGLVLVAVVVAACGSSGSESGKAGSSNASNTEKTRYAKELSKAFKGSYELPTGGPVKPPPGKSVWVVSVGQSLESAQAASAAMVEAGSKLGWKVHVFDGRFESGRALVGVEQALAAGAEGIVLLYSDCAPVKAGLLAAKQAGVAVVGIESKDCDPSLETNIRFGSDQNFVEYEEDDFGGIQAKWVIGTTEGEAKTIITVGTDVETTRAAGRGVRKQFKTCPSCEIVDEIRFVSSELGPALQEKIEQALSAHPEANSFIAAYDAVLTSGGAAALRASGRLGEMKVMGGEGSPQAIELIYGEAGNDACNGLAPSWEGYEAIMLLARGFAGQSVARGNSGIGGQACDKEHNLPAKGTGWKPPIDFVAAYEEAWGLR